MQSAFIHACKEGQLDIALKLYDTQKINIHATNDYAFRWSCRYGHIETAKWLYSLGGVNIHASNDDAFRWSCYYGHIEIAKWLLSLDRFDNTMINELQPENDHICKLIFRLEYTPVNDHMRNKYNIYLKHQCQYLRTLIKSVGKLNCLYNKVCLQRYAFGGDGYLESKRDFDSLIEN